VIVLGERLELPGWIGVGLLLAGILALQKPWAVFRRSSQMPRHVREAAAFALLTGVTITAYSAVDRDGARLIDPLFYAAMLWTFGSIFLLSWIGLVVRRDRQRAAAAEVTVAAAEVPRPGLVGRLLSGRWTRAGIGGLITVAAYLFVLVAYRYAPLTAVAPLRESAIVIISGWGSFRLKEARGRRDATIRMGVAVIVVIGAVLLATEG
jgi:drug/metabolite transporter (DMT)-like permease